MKVAKWVIMVGCIVGIFVAFVNFPIFEIVDYTNVAASGFNTFVLGMTNFFKFGRGIINNLLTANYGIKCATIVIHWVMLKWFFTVNYRLVTKLYKFIFG